MNILDKYSITTYNNQYFLTLIGSSDRLFYSTGSLEHLIAFLLAEVRAQVYAGILWGNSLNQALEDILELHSDNLKL